MRCVCGEPEGGLPLRERRAWISQGRRPGKDHPSPPTCPLLALAPEGSPACLRSSPQATDEDSPPNNQITYSIVNASAFGSYFDISVYEGYGGICAGAGGHPGRRGGGPEQGGTPTTLGGVGRGGRQCQSPQRAIRRGVAVCLPDTLDKPGSCPTAISQGEGHRPGIALL